MFKLKPGNVFQKINKMDKKQAYTWGAIVIVAFVALLTLASFMGDADDASFDNFNTRGYDLAQMPFLNDEAEEYLLAAKYPDMQGNNSTMLYSAAEKEARQEADAEAAEEAAEEAATEDASTDMGGSYSSGSGYSGGGYSGGGGTSAPTQVGQLNSASINRASGSGVSTSWGAPRGDFSPYKSQEKGSEMPVQLKNQDARRALSQFAQASRAAAGLKDSKGANAKRALMGGHVQGSEAFTEGGVDLRKSGGLALDTNAPVSTADLSNLDKAVADAAKDGKDDKDDAEDDFRETMEDRLREQLWSGMIDMGLQAMGNLLNQGLDSLQGAVAGNKALNRSLEDAGASFSNQELTAENKALLEEQFGADAVKEWMDKNPNGRIWQCQSDLSTRGTGDGRLQVVPSEPTMPQKQDFVGDGSSNDNGIITLNETDQRRYDEQMEIYEQQKEDYEEYQNSTESERRAIEKSRMKHNEKLQRKATEAFAERYKQNIKSLKEGPEWENAALARDIARATHTGKNYIDTSKFSLPDRNSPSSSRSGGDNWWSSYGSDYGDSDKYDQSIVAGCKNHAAPRTCLEGAKKKKK